jgi:hypothetical protein
VTEFERFQQIVFADPELWPALLQEREIEPFIELVMRLAREHGCDVADKEVRDALQSARRSWLERHVR